MNGLYVRLDEARKWLGERRLRLFAVGCARLVWDQLEPFPEYRRGVEWAEDAVDAPLSAAKLLAEAREVVLQAFGVYGEGSEHPAFGLALGCTVTDAYQAAGRAWVSCRHLGKRSAFGVKLHGTGRKVVTKYESAQERDLRSEQEFLRLEEECNDLLDCVAGPRNGFVSKAYRTPPEIVTWNDFTPQRIALEIYQQRAWDRLPILADALEDAGLDEAAILEHLRGPGPHCRGCWYVDKLLGKE
jgi:hypothetical protein